MAMGEPSCMHRDPKPTRPNNTVVEEKVAGKVLGLLMLPVLWVLASVFMTVFSFMSDKSETE